MSVFAPACLPARLIVLTCDALGSSRLRPQMHAHSVVSRMVRALGEYEVFKAEALHSPVFEIALFLSRLGKELAIPAGVSVVDRYVVFLCEEEDGPSGLTELVEVERFHPRLLHLHVRESPESTRDMSFVRHGAHAIDHNRRDRLFHTICVKFKSRPIPDHRPLGQPRDVFVVLAPRAVMELATHVLKTVSSRAGRA